MVKALKDPGVQERLTDYEIFGSSPEEFTAFIKREIDKIGNIIRTSGAKVDS